MIWKIKLILIRVLRLTTNGKEKASPKGEESPARFSTTKKMDTFWLKRAQREFDREPISAHLYVTDRCNLDCFYCTEFDNSVPHPEFEDLKKWIAKIKDLGCVRIGLQGGEPLMHPDIVEIVRFCKSLDLKTSIATNGFKITKELIARLEDARLDSIHVSVDRMTPIRSTRKSLKSVMRKFELLKESNLKYSMSGVLFEESIDEAKQVIDYGLDNDIPVQSRLVHAGTNGKFAVKQGGKEALKELLDYQEKKKRQGKRIQCSGLLIDYQRDLLSGKETEWDLYSRLQVFLRFSARKILALQHETNAEYRHHGCHT